MEINSQKQMRLFEISFAIYTMWYFLPIVRGSLFGGIWNVVFFSCYVVSVGLAFLKNLRIETSKFTKRAVYPIIAYMVLLLFYMFFGETYLAGHIRVSFTFWGTFLFFMMTEKYSESQKRIAKFVLILFLVTYATTFYQLATDPSLARKLTDASVEEDLRRVEMMKNIGDIYVVQMSILFVPFLMDLLIFKAKKTFHKILGLGILVLEFYFILSASFTISLIVYVVSIAMSILLLSGSKSTMNTVMKVAGVGFFALILMQVDWVSLFDSIASSIGNKYIAERFYGLRDMFITGVGTGDASDRPILYLMSLETFYKNIYGVGLDYSYIPGSSGIGMHSQIFDDLARYGVLAVAFYITFFRNFYKMLFLKFKEIEMERAVLPTILTYILFLCVNIGFRSPYESLIMLFVFPALPLLFSKESKAEGKESILKEENAQ